jgi:hypothetical protein
MLASCGGSQPPIGAPVAMALSHKKDSEIFESTGAEQTFIVPKT